MFVRASTLVLSLVGFAAFASAAPGSSTGSQCDTGTMQCCQQTQDASSGSDLLDGLLGIIGSITGLIGTDCTPITVIGVGSGSDCQQQPLCCTDMTEDGLINFGCSPLNLNL